MYTSQQHQLQHQQPLDGCYRIATAYQLDRSDSSDSSNFSSISGSSISRSSSNISSVSSNDSCGQEEDKERLWVVDGLYFTCKESDPRARSAVKSTTISSARNPHTPISFPTYPSPSSPTSTPTKTAPLPLSPPPTPTKPVRPPLIRIESQELLPTRRPGLSFRRSSSSNSLNSLASRRSNTSRREQQQHQQQQKLQQPHGQQQKNKQSNVVVPTKPLKSILKKIRPVTPTSTASGRHHGHVHLGPMLQQQYQQLLQQQQQHQQQASPYSQDGPPLQRRASAPHHKQLQRSSSVIITSSSLPPQPPSPPQPPRRPRPMSSPAFLDNLFITTQSRPLPQPPRPLPTPPAIKTVRWASHNEIFVIENIEDLIEMGYYDDYDSEMGWDYRDESLDDDFSVTMDSDEDDLGSDFDPREEEEEEVVVAVDEEELQSPSEDGRFEYMYRQRMLERSAFDDDEGEEDEEECEVESSVAEDELIHRMASDQFLSGSGSSNGAMWPSLPSPPPTITSRDARSMSVSPSPPPMASPSSPTTSRARSMSASPSPPPMVPPSSPLSPSFWSPPPQEQYNGVSGIIQRFQSLENQNHNSGFARGTNVGSSGMMSPPESPPFPHFPPRRSSLMGHSTVIKNDSGGSLSPTPLAYLTSPSGSASTSPKLLPVVPLLTAPPGPKGKRGGPPKLDRGQILAEVAERKRRGVGAFAGASATASSRYRVDRPLSMVTCASNLLRCS
ncbi:hypothetical protein BG015_010660 [Linnemannia schmuckeri]|uniref:Uncharacterized protein n=1 Tax=Linnemannia schmuckeri TaxID=64567 RepID=A0A9P5RWH1_9FUNG|nr:hypothetical protein BG015_010660 [Linnemannia schmuckeri]